MNRPRILVAGIGNIFLGDDAFGVEVAQRLAQRLLPSEVRVVDFGIRGLDLTYALLEGYETVIFVDATPRGGQTGSLYLLELDRDGGGEATETGAEINPHGMDPVKVLRLAASMGARVDRLFLVGCEPAPLDEANDMHMGLSDPVEAAVEEAIGLIKTLLGQLLRSERIGVP